MTTQQINLYLPELRPRKEWLTANTIVICAAGFLFLLLAGSYFQNQSLEKKSLHVASLESQTSSSADRIKSITESARPVDVYKLDRQIAKLKQSIQAREQIGQIIQGQNLGNELGFSESMLALSRSSLATISLQRIKISRGGSFIEAKGRTSAARDVPRYIQKLRREASLADTQFGLLSLSEARERAQLYNFTMGFDAVSTLAGTVEVPR